MALDRLSQVTSSGLASPINIGIATLTSTVVGSAVTINSSGIDVAGIVTATTANFVNATISGDLTVEGTTTTLDTILTEVDKLEVGANNTTVGVAITQSGTGDILRLYDGASQVFTVTDGGSVGIGTDNPVANFKLDVNGDLSLGEYGGSDNTYIDQKQNGNLEIINSGVNANSGSIRINKFNNIAGGTTYYRDFIVYDGKNNVIQFVDGSSGSVGIGTDNPVTNFKLDVNGDLSLGEYGGVDNTYIDQKQNGSLDIINSGRDADNGRIRINQYNNISGDTTYYRDFEVYDGKGSILIMADGSSGNVGIGTNNPSNPLHISTSSTTPLLVESTGADSYIRFQNSGGSSGYVGYLYDQEMVFWVNGSERLRIDSNGRVAIGITESAHSYIQTIYGHTTGNRSAGTVYQNAATGNDSSNGFLIGNSNGTDAYIWNYESANIQFATGGQEKLRITSGGDVGIGTTNPDKKLRVEGDARITGTLTMGTASIEIAGDSDFPTIRPTLDLNFAATKTLDRRITFTRDSIATYTDELGIVRYASNNVPRFDHDPETGESLGLLIEESRTNLVPDSTTYNGWTTYSSSIPSITQETLAPDGTYSAIKIISTGTQSQFGFREELSYSANTVYTHSMWLKAGTATRVGLTISSSSRWSTAPYLVVDLDTGTVNSTGGSISTKLTAYPNGWYLLEATGEFGGTSQTDGIWSYTATTGGHSGDTTSYYYQWGGQVEVGSFPTSYIPTSGSTVTRAADLAKITGTNFTDFYNQTEGTFFVDSAVARGSAYQGYVGSTTSSAEDGGPSYNFNSIMSDDDNSDVVLNIWNGTGSSQSFISIAHPAGNMKAAGAFKNNDFALSVNGSSASTDPSGTIDENQDQLWIGRRPYTSAGWLNNSIKRVTYYNKRLTNAQLQSLTRQ